MLNTRVCVFEARNLADITYNARKSDDNIIFLILDIKNSPFF